MRTETGSAARERTGGYTLIEVSIALVLISLTLGTIATIYPALTEASVETRLFMISQIENDKARLDLVEDLQTTDTTRNDANGVPYFQIVDHGGGTANSIIFRKVEDYNSNEQEDLVTSGYGPSIQYWVNEKGRLIRTQNGVDKIVATNVKGIQFAKSLEGAVTIHITTEYTREQETHDVDTEVQIVPRNVLKM